MSVVLIAMQELKRVLRDPSGLLLTLALPLALTVAVGFISGRVPLGRPPSDGFDALSYVAPGMALFAMMFSVRQAAKTTVDDADRGITRRLRSAPIGEISIAVGRTLSGVVMVAAQLLLLVGVSSALYGLRWGSPLPVLLLCLALSLSAGGWAALLVSLGRTSRGVGTLGTALTLVFAILSRSFAAVVPSAPWMDALSRITPNHWGLHGFSALALSGTLGSIAPDLLRLVLMSVTLWILAPLAGRLMTWRRKT
ncbi:MAG TPA: ABC transporter permease [Spirochaetia bacterium]|nr:ABC transporter permease [Spirochaetia bacterium]